MSKDWKRDALLVIVSLLSLLLSVGIPTTLIFICLRGCVNGCHRMMEDGKKSHEKFERDMKRAMDEKVKRALEDDSESARWNRFIRGASEADSRGIKSRNSDQSR